MMLSMVFWFALLVFAAAASRLLQVTLYYPREKASLLTIALVGIGLMLVSLYEMYVIVRLSK